VNDIASIDAYRGREGIRVNRPQTNLKRLVNKNAKKNKK
jgi:hypothetical protein